MAAELRDLYTDPLRARAAEQAEPITDKPHPARAHLTGPRLVVHPL
jgi:hypothetical protein